MPGLLPIRGIRLTPRHPDLMGGAAILVVSVISLVGVALAQPSGSSATPPAAINRGNELGLTNALEITGKLIGATVLTKDRRLAGAVDDVINGSGQDPRLVIGLAGFLGAGEKDVAISASGAKRGPTRAGPLTQDFADSKYGGSSSQTLIVPMTLQELISSPAYHGDEAPSTVGGPSPNSGNPEQSHDRPPSSTRSGGPG
jgi:hypothetical protein